MKTEKSVVVKSHIRGTLFAVILSLALVLLFALIIKISAMPNGAVKPIAQIIKVISIFFGVGVTVRRINRLGWLHGAIMGLLYTVFAFFIFSIVDANFDISVGFLTDMLFCLVVGAVSGMLLKFRKVD